MHARYLLFRFCALLFFFVLSSFCLRASSDLPNDIELNTKLDLFASSAKTPKHFLNKYKNSSLKFDIDFTYRLIDKFYFNFLPYIQHSYDITNQDKTQTKARIWQAYFSYNSEDFNFTFGRFDFTDRALAPYIYYGDNLNRDLSLPTSLDGLKHSFISKYFDYTLLAAREAQIDDYKKADLAGSKITVKPFSWINFSGFYFLQNKKYSETRKNTEINLSVYGAGLDLFFQEDAGINFYFAKNGGRQKITRPSGSQTEEYKGYAFNGEIYFQKSYKAGNLKNKIGFYLFSDKDDFYSFPNKLNTGIIWGGMNYAGTFPKIPKIIYADFNFNFKKYPFLFAGAGIFMYVSKKEDVASNQTYYAREINLNTGLKFDTCGFVLSGGLFDGEAFFLGETSTDKQKVKKIQANFFYKFGL